MEKIAIVILLRQACVMSLSLCEGNSVLECDESRNFSTFTCTGLTSSQTAWWQMTYDNQIVKLGSCPPLTGGTSTCIPGSQTKVFQISRTSATASSISAFSGTSLSALSDKGFLTCTSVDGNDETSCPFDYIYAASGATCQVYFSTIGTWSVVVNCSINRARSKRGRYTCQLRQTIKSGTTVLLPAVQMSVTQTLPDGYVSGVCNITSFLPSEGQYTYEVTITPGNVNVSANFIGSNIIRVPRFQPSHNCSLYVDEGSTLSCRCSVNDSGDPAGFLRWDSFNSSELLLKDIQKSQNGMQSVCRLTWNNTVQQSVSHTLIVAYQPTAVNFTMNDINSKSVSVVENSTVTMKCQADGRPVPAMIITKVSDNSVVKSSPEGNITVEDKRGEVTHTVVVAQCSDSDDYRCEAKNSRGMKNQSVNLFVKCTPRRVPTQSNSSVPSIFEGKSESFELIAYPTSVNLTKYHLGPNITDNEGAASDDTFSAQCTPIPGVVYKITCTVTVNRVTSDSADYYKLRVNNGLGEIEFIFQAKPRDTRMKLCQTPDGYIEIMAKTSKTLTCSGLSVEDNVTWVLSDSLGENWIGTCPPLHANATPSACSTGSLPMFTIRRISGTDSTITIDTTNVSDASYFASKELQCVAQVGSSQNKETCQLDYVYPAEDAKCRVYLNGEVGIVGGYCTVSKILSAANRYLCWFYQSKAEASESTFVGSYPMQISSISGTSYKSGNCSFESVFPSEGRYTYRAILVPGGANVSASFVGTDTIYRPMYSPIHNCPSYIQEGSSLDCSCFAKDQGSPPGKVQWDTTGSAQLTRAIVSSADYGTQFTCNVIWNNTAEKSVTYTLYVTYQPTFVEVTINSQSRSSTVNESESVNIVCQANGQPKPKLRLEMDTGREIRVVLGGAMSNTNEKSMLTFTLHGARVQDTGVYSCLANNGLGRGVSSSASLYVKGPLLVFQDSFSAERNSYPFINYRGNPETLTFEILTYEIPNQYTFVFLGMDPRAVIGLFPRLDVLKSECAPGDLLQKTKCTVTAVNITEDDIGFYNLTLENSMGSLTVTFYLQRYAPGEDSSGSHLKLQLGLGIGLGLAGLAICLLIIILIFKWRRQKEANESGHSIMSPDETLEHTDNRPRSTIECEGAYDAIHLDETAMRASYLALRVPTTSRQEERKSNEYELPVNNDSSKTTSSPQIHTYSNL